MSGASIANAVITIQGGSDSARTDTLGNFSLRVRAGTAGSVSVSHADYQRLTLPLDSATANAFHLDAELLPAAPAPGSLSVLTSRLLGVVRTGSDSLWVTYQLDKSWFDTNEHRLVTVSGVGPVDALRMYGTAALHGALLISLRGSRE